MIIEDDALLERMRRTKKCEWCGRFQPNGCDPAHIYSRGAGRVDIPKNLAAICRLCHVQSHQGLPPTREHLLAIAAKREGCTVESITEEVYRIRRTPK